MKYLLVVICYCSAINVCSADGSRRNRVQLQSSSKRKFNSFDDSLSKHSYIFKSTVSEEKLPIQLLDYVICTFNTVKRNQAKKWLSTKFISVNGIPQTQFNFQLNQNDIVSIASARSLNGKDSSVNDEYSIVYDDNDLLVIDSSQKFMDDIGGRNNTVTARLTKLQAKLSTIRSKTINNAERTSKIFPVSRISDECTGLIVCAKSAEARNDLKRAWRTFGKTYICICEGLLTPANGCIRSLLNVSSEVVAVLHNGSFSEPHGPPSNDCRWAVSNYRSLQTARVSGRWLSLVEVSLDSELRDQVRAQLSHLGHPLLGDLTYCGPMAPDPLRRLALHFSELRMRRPGSGEPLTLRAPTPRDFGQLLLGGEPFDGPLRKECEEEEGPGGSGRTVRLLAVGDFLRTRKPPRPRGQC